MSAYNTAYSLWQVKGCPRGFRFVSSFGFSGSVSTLKPPQAICEPIYLKFHLANPSTQGKLTQTRKSTSRMNNKKKLLSLLTGLFFTSISLLAQGHGPISTGQAQLNGGVGFSGWGIPFYAGLDYGVHPDVTVGAEFSYRRYRERYFGFDFNHRITGISANGNYHFNTLLDIPSNIDLYAGLNVGFYIWNTNDSNYKGNGASGLGLGAQIGGRYYFDNHWGINLELGGANTTSGGKFGVSYRF